MKWPASGEVSILGTGGDRHGAYRYRSRKQGKAKCAFATASARLLRKSAVARNQLGRYLGKRAPGRVVLETCTEAFRIAGGARQQGHDVRVVAATLVRSLGVGQRGLKNDRRDARALSEASCRMELPSVHIPSVVSQEVKAICVSREALIKTRTQLVSRVRSYVRSRFGAPLPSHTGEPPR